MSTMQVARGKLWTLRDLRCGPGNTRATIGADAEIVNTYN